MSILITALILICGILLHPVSVYGQSNVYPWHGGSDSTETLAARVPPPIGYQRVAAPPGTFAHWLQHLPLKKGTPPVYFYNGKKKANQDAHVAVVDIDVGAKNLQQCADAIIRLRAEYLFSRGKHEKIHFNFTSGDTARWSRWLAGFRPEINQTSVRWSKTAAVDSSYQNFRQYLETVFTYAGSYSLNLELVSVDSIGKLHIGDVFIEGGFPGHAVIVVDMAFHPASGERVLLLAQSYMPAQDIHILRNHADASISPWYKLEFGDWLNTPEWRFGKRDLKRFR